MWGEGMGELNVYTQPWNDFSRAQRIWRMYGNAGKTWRSARVTIPPTSYNFQVCFNSSFALIFICMYIKS